MRFAFVLAALVACGGGGESIPFDRCDHTTIESTCCVTDQSCVEGDRCVQPEPRTVTAFCASDDECSEGEFCDLPVGRCDELGCAIVDDCPPDFDCLSESCVRNACETSDECSAFCVEGQCYQRAGECR